jgi:hypothetical protein
MKEPSAPTTVPGELVPSPQSIVAVKADAGAFGSVAVKLATAVTPASVTCSVAVLSVTSPGSGRPIKVSRCAVALALPSSSVSVTARAYLPELA